MKAFTALLIVAVGFTGLALLASLAALFLIPRHERGTILTNLALAGAALGFLIISGLMGTIAANVAADKTNELGDDIGLSAKMGTGYIVLTWVAVGLMMIALGYWLWQLMGLRRGKSMALPRGRMGARKNVRDSEESGVVEMRTTR